MSLRVFLTAIAIVAVQPGEASAGQIVARPGEAVGATADPAIDPAAKPGSSCPGESTGSEIVVCGRGKQEEFRLKPSDDRWDPNGVVDSVFRERRRMLELGDAGIHSCSTIGPAGWTGCQFKRWREAQEQNPNRQTSRPGVPTIRFGRLGQ